ncbi:hypothetical protein Dda_5519 [Drechslerella dactyloides]|uniref:Uncharacterized protein n=1 Tax=Drechslerella dactyloides TaxID=74499 RepID=A0AAD6IYG4_DREDA|nr:hypothetical protein Dda_5519 [Drechslerella dactyloides]
MSNPPPPLVVNDITAIPSFALSTTDPNEIITLPAFPTQVFDSQSPTKYVDTSNPTNASLRPIAFAYPVDAPTPKTFKIALKLALNFTAPPEWSAVPTSKCVVLGSLVSDPLKPIFQSDEIPASNAKGTWTVDSVNVEFPQVMLNAGGKLPFKWAGTFIWTIKVVNNPLLIAPPTVIPSVLEFYFTNVPAPEGHKGTFGNPILAKTPEFNKIYPVTLLRQFWPVAADIPGGEPLRQEKLNEFYCQNVIKVSAPIKEFWMALLFPQENQASSLILGPEIVKPICLIAWIKRDPKTVSLRLPLETTKLQLKEIAFDRGYMVGVTSTNLTYPIAPYLQGDDSVIGIPNAFMPVGLKNDINALLKLGDSGARESRTIIVDAPLDANSLAAALKPLDATASGTSLSRSVFNTINTFSNSFKLKAGEFDAVFESYRSYTTAKARLVHYLTTFSIGPLASFVKASPKLDQALGHICLWMDSEIVIVYGNLFTKITIKSPSGLSPDLWTAISSLFKFIKTNTTGKTKQFNPLEELTPDKIVALKSGDTVPISLEKKDDEVVGTMALIYGGDQDTGEAYVWQMKAGDSSGKFTFRVAGLGEQKVVLTVGDANKGLVRSVAYTFSISSAT